MKRRLLAVFAVLLLGCSSKPQVVHDYDHAPVPPVPERTMQVASGDSPLTDGTYWASAVRVRSGAAASDASSIEWYVTQALFGPSCEAAGGTDCANGYVPVLSPNRTMSSPLSVLTSITVAAESRQNFGVTSAEFARLAGGDAPSSAAPTGYAYRAYPYLITVTAGLVVAARQIWVPAVLEPQPGW